MHIYIYTHIYIHFFLFVFYASGEITRCAPDPGTYVAITQTPSRAGIPAVRGDLGKAGRGGLP